MFFGVLSADVAAVASVASAVVVALVITLAGVFTLRANMKTFWRDLADERGEQIQLLEEHLRAKAAELVTLQAAHVAEMVQFGEEQRDLRHALKSELATTQHSLALEMGKHDLSAVVAKLDALHRRLDEHDGRLTQLLTHLEGT